MLYNIYLGQFLALVVSAVVLVFLFKAYQATPHGGLAVLMCAALLGVCVAASSLVFYFAFFGFSGTGSLSTSNSGWYYIFSYVMFGCHCLVSILSAVGTILLAQAYATLARQRQPQP